MKRRNWTLEEIASLESIASTTYPPRVCEEYNRWANRSGYRARSRWSIISAMSRHKISRKPECSFVTSGYISEILGISLDVPQRWFEKGYVDATWNGNQRSKRYYKRSDLVAMARRHPELLGGISRDRLFALLEDADLADSIAVAYPTHKGAGRPIQVVETGAVFPSVSAAARAFYVRPQSIYFAMRQNRTCAGYHWKHVQPAVVTNLCQIQEQQSLNQLSA